MAKIKSDDTLKKIPVIILSTSEDEEDISNTYSNHANCYIIKPDDFNDFVTMAKSIEDFWTKQATLPEKQHD